MVNAAQGRVDIPGEMPCAGEYRGNWGPFQGKPDGVGPASTPLDDDFRDMRC
jgi:hypothetical protein